MHWFRTIRRSIHLLIGLFLLAQFAGVVPSPLVGGRAAAHALDAHAHDHHHAHQSPDRASADKRGERHAGHFDDCCALHAFFAGVLPTAAVIEHATLMGVRIGPKLAEGTLGVTVGTPERPPKPLP